MIILPCARADQLGSSRDLVWERSREAAGA